MQQRLPMDDPSALASCVCLGPVCVVLACFGLYWCRLLIVGKFTGRSSFTVNSLSASAYSFNNRFNRPSNTLTQIFIT